ncbi:GTP-binding protein A [Echria macrotheca]|uniref:GTP-binding protein A n=1 Tax=Echria macrotheca TaxID=438768 RepID=A0AAJ0F4N8_9PEZI|nr:GTP-binding protein A [Echria macrotheca]
MAPQLEKDRPVVIVLVGVTGAGKSTFASIASGRDLVVGHGLDPCTKDPLAVSFNMEGREIVLIDTPGFDDDIRTDVEILGDIAEWLAKHKYISKDNPVDGLILLHPATHSTITGNERKRTRLLQKILGEDAYRRVIIATTMWENLEADEWNTLGGQERIGENGLWERFLMQGSTLTRHQNSKDSAHQIIRQILSMSSRKSKVESFLDDQMLGSLDEEIQLQLEEAFDLTSKILRDHMGQEPPRKWKRSRNPWRLWKYREWELEKQELEKKLEAQEKVVERRNVKAFFKWLF